MVSESTGFLKGMKLQYYIAMIKLSDTVVYAVTYDYFLDFPLSSGSRDKFEAFLYYKVADGTWERTAAMKSAKDLLKIDIPSCIKDFGYKWFSATGFTLSGTPSHYFEIKKALFKLLSEAKELGLKCSYSSSANRRSDGASDITKKEFEDFIHSAD